MGMSKITEHTKQLRIDTATKAKRAKRGAGLVKSVSIELNAEEYNNFITVRARQNLRNKDILFIGLNNLKNN